MITIKFSIIRDSRYIFVTTIEAPSYRDAKRSYQEMLLESEIEIKPFDILKGKIISNNN